MITRDNYDEFFMLYVDNELSPAERRVVEAFVAENVDLKAELDILLQCRLDPEYGLIFVNRESLLKQTPVAQNPLPQEESLLLYIDRELDEDARRSVESLSRRDPSILRELTLLQQTVIEPDPALVFKNKELLYKRERDKWIAFLPIFRILAAASVLLAFGLLIFNTVRKNTAPSLAANGKLASGKLVVGKVTIGRKDHPDVTPVHVDSLNLVMSLPQVPMRQTKMINNHVKRSVAGNQPTQIKNDPIASPRQVSGGLAELVETNTGKGIPQIQIDRKFIDRGNIAIIGPGDETASEGKRENAKESSFATEALHDEMAATTTAYDSGAGDEEAGSDTPKKNKLRGVFRKVSRVFEKNANRDDDEKRGILIGNLQIALK